jgi:hypothetical protein
MDVARRAKKEAVPINSTVSADPVNDRSTAAIDKRLNGTPQIHPRITGAASAATMNVRVMG